MHEFIIGVMCGILAAFFAGEIALSASGYGRFIDCKKYQSEQYCFDHYLKQGGGK